MAIIQHKRGSTQDWKNNKDLILRAGEISVQYCEDKSVIIKVGDGKTTYENLKSLNIPGYVKESELENILKEINSRVDRLIGLPEGSTTGDAQLADLQGTVANIEDDLDYLKENLNEFIDVDVVDGLKYEDNILYLTSKGEPISEGVKIEGGGGGGSSTLQVKLEMLNETNTFYLSETQSAIISFLFSSIEYGSITGQCTCNIYRNGVHKHSLKIPNNERVDQDVTEFLTVGYNEIVIECMDLYGNKRQLVYSINVISLEISSTFSDSDVIYGDAFSFNYNQTGNIDKQVHLIINPGDTELHIIKELKKGSNKQQTIENIDITAFSHGTYPMDVYMTSTIGEDKIESNHLYYDIMIAEDNEIDPLISSCYKVSEVTQGDLISIPFTIFHPGKYSCDVTLRLSYMNNGKEESQDTIRTVISETKNYWNLRNVPTGSIKLSIIYEGVTKSHVVFVNDNELDVDAYETGLELFLTAEGRSNADKNYSSWDYNDITTSFTDFNWRTNGWLPDANGDTCLRLNGDAKIEINLTPFSKDAKINGKTLEFEFAIRDVNNRAATVIECFDETVGIKATADKMSFTSTNDQVFCNYTENQRVRVAFTVSKLDNNSASFLCVYLNGILSGIKHITSNDGFAQSPAQTITIGSAECGIDLYSIRSYNVCLSDEDIVTNYIADIPNINEKLDVFSDNDIYVDEKISYTKVKSKIPTITFIGKMPTFKGDKRPLKDVNGKIIKGTEVRMIFEHPTKPELNFDEILKQIDVQGTSSAGYVRKNWKTKHNTAHTHMEGELPAKVFCIKVDYAEATGTHNTQNANLIETFYDTPVPPMLIPEEIDLSGRNLDTVDDISKVRTTIAGFPVVIFHLDTDDDSLIKELTIAQLESGEYDLVFSSKGNFNYDKDAEDVFAFNDDYDVECWEFLKNEDPQSFLTPWPDTPLDYWEPRYHSRLGDLEDLQDSKRDDEAKELADEMFVRFKEMYEWVHSTARGKYNNIPQATGLELTTAYVDDLGKTYNYDTDDYRLAKFRTEFNKYFNLEYTAIYYVYTFFALMVDQRAKNVFLTYWRDNAYGPNDDTNPGKWYPYFYDNDTCYGISNKGHLDFDYYHQDDDSINGSNVFNGANSVLWCNFRDAFPTIIQNTYSRLRSTGKLSFNNIINQFIKNGSDQWSAALYNQDADYKYISVDTDEVDGEVTSYPYLYQVRGSGEHHLEYFVDNRIKFCDSKWKCGDYMNDTTHTARVNIYNPTTSDDYKQCAEWELNPEGPQPAYYPTYLKIKNSIALRPADTTISILPFSRIYYAVQYGRPSGDDATKGMISKLASDTTTPLIFEHTDTTNLNDFETTIFGARDISSLGDLSSLYAKEVVIKNCVKLTELTVGCDEVGPNRELYYNPNLTNLTTGSNTLLRSINVSNCPNLKGTLNLSGCINIEKVKAIGSGISSLSLPDGGYITELYLPDSFNNLELKGQKYLTNNGIIFNNYESLQKLNIDNCPSIDALALLEKCRDKDGNYTVKFLRLTDIDLGEVTYNYLVNVLGNIGGIDDSGIDYYPDANAESNKAAYIQGKCKISTLTGEELAKIKDLFPHLVVYYDTLELSITYKSEDGSNNIYEVKTTFTNGSTEEGVTTIDPVVQGLVEKPTKESTAQYHFEFGGWSRNPNSKPNASSLENIIADTILYAAFNNQVRSYPVRFFNGNKLEKTVEVEYSKNADFGDIDPIKNDTNNWDVYEFIGWEPKPDNITGPLDCYAQFQFNEADEDLYPFPLSDFDYVLIENGKLLAISKYKGIETAGKILDTYKLGNEYEVNAIQGFSRTPIEIVVLPNKLQNINMECFSECKNLVLIEIPKSVIYIDHTAFKSTESLEKITVEAGNPNFISKNNCVIDTRNNTLIIGCKNSIIPDDGSVTIIGSYAFWGQKKLSSIIIPDCITKINSYSFTDSGITNFDLPDSCLEYGAMAFYGTPIRDIIFPKNTRYIGMFCTNACKNLQSITIKQSDPTCITIDERAFEGSSALEVINVPWAEGAVANAPWGAPNAIINYNYVEV